MADRPVPTKPRFRFRASPQGIAVLVLPPLAFVSAASRHSAPAFVLGLGLPILAVFSLIFLLSCLPSLIRSSANILEAATRIPNSARIGELLELRTDPAVPGFLPGIRLRVEWRLAYGPYTRRIIAPLAKDGGSAAFRFDRRGLWEGPARLVAVDPFGFFAVSIPLAGNNGTAVPPDRAERQGRIPPGRPAADARTAPRIREDAEERYERRGYVPGDDPRRIDWKQYARTGDLLVRTGEDALPHKGRVWILAVGAPASFPSRRGYGRLDDCLAAAAALVHRSLEDDIDVRLKFPGGSWREAARFDWEAAMAGAEPASASPADLPPRGETLRIVAHPSEALAPALADAARESGCRVSLVFPAEKTRPAQKAVFSLFRAEDAMTRGGSRAHFEDALYRRRLENALLTARVGGADAYVL